MATPRRTPLVLLQVANLVSGVSNAVVALAFPWLVLEETGSATAAGAVAAVSALPALVAAPLTGWLIDHLGRKVVSVFSDILSAISVAAIPIFALVAELNYAEIVAFAVIGAIFDPAGYSARRALIPDAAAAADFDVDRLNGIHQGIFALGWTTGPVVAAGLIELLGPINAFWLPTALFVVAAISVAAMRVGDAGQVARAERDEVVTGAASLFRGFTTLWTDRPLRLLTFSVLLISAVYWPTETVVLPAHFNALDTAASLGVVISALAGGSMVGAFAYGWISKRLRPSTLVRCIMIGTSLSMLPMALLPPLPVMVLFAFLLGLSWGPFDPLMSTLVQKRIPADEHGRVYGAQLSAFYAAPPLGMVVAGFGVDRYGVSATYLVLAGLVTLAAIRIIPSKSVRELDHD